MVLIASAVKDHSFYPFFSCPFSHYSTHYGRLCLLRLFIKQVPHCRIEGGGCSQSQVTSIVDNLRIDVQVTPKDIQARPLCHSANLCPYSALPPCPCTQCFSSRINRISQSCSCKYSRRERNSRVLLTAVDYSPAPTLPALPALRRTYSPR